MAPPSSSIEPALFKAFLVIRDDGRTTRAVYSYPQEGHRVLQKYPILPRFAFPSVPGCREGSMNYTFVLTDELGKRLYGHTQHLVSVIHAAEVIVILSPFPWCNFFANVASHYRSLAAGNAEEAKRAVESLAAQPLPLPGKPFAAPFGGRWLARPWDMPGYEFADTNPATLLPVFPNNDDLLTLLSSLLLERHVVVCGPTFQAVTSVMMQCLALMTPFEWQHIFVPVVPGPELYDVLAAPTPYFIGLIDAQLPALHQVEVDDLCFVQLQELSESAERTKIRCTSVQLLAPRIESEGAILPRSGRTSSLRWTLRALRTALALHRTASGEQTGLMSWIAPWELASSPMLANSPSLVSSSSSFAAAAAPPSGTHQKNDGTNGGRGSSNNGVSFAKPSKRSKSLTKRIRGGGAFGLDLDVCGLFLRYYAEWLSSSIVARLTEFRQSSTSTAVAAPASTAAMAADPVDAPFLSVFRNSQCFAELADHSAECLLRLEAEMNCSSSSGTNHNDSLNGHVSPVKSGDTTNNDPLANSMRRRASFNNNAAAAAAAAAKQQAQERTGGAAPRTTSSTSKRDDCCPHNNPFLHELLQHHPEWFPNAAALVKQMERHCTAQCRAMSKKPRRASIRALLARTFSCCTTTEEHSDDDEEELTAASTSSSAAVAAAAAETGGGANAPEIPPPVFHAGKGKMYRVSDQV
jgi:hypothetical protein